MKKLFIPPVFVFTGIFLIVLFYFRPGSLMIIPFPFNLTGLIIAFSGFILMGKARELFAKHKTTLDIKESQALVTGGIYAKTRNPMYSGMFLFLLGLAVCFQNVLSLLVPFVFLLIIILFFIPLEEKLMTRVFGEKYLDYKNHTPRWF